MATWRPVGHVAMFCGYVLWLVAWSSVFSVKVIEVKMEMKIICLPEDLSKVAVLEIRGIALRPMRPTQ